MKNCGIASPRKKVKYMAICEDMEKVRRFKREKARLRRIFKPMEPMRFKAAEGLLAETAFMRVALEDLRAVIDSDGIIEMFEQGPNRYLRQHPAVKSYLSMVQRYTACCKLLLDMLPTPDQDAADDELMAFVRRQSR